MRLSQFAAIIEAVTPYTLYEARLQAAGYVATIGRDLPDGQRACISVMLSATDLETAHSPTMIVQELVKEATGKLDAHLASALTLA